MRQTDWPLTRKKPAKLLQILTNHYLFLTGSQTKRSNSPFTVSKALIAHGPSIYLRLFSCFFTPSATKGFVRLHGPTETLGARGNKPKITITLILIMTVATVEKLMHATNENCF